MGLEEWKNATRFVNAEHNSFTFDAPASHFISIMKTTFIVLCLFCTSSGSIAGALTKAEIDPAKVPALLPHYQAEYTFDTSTDPASWSKQKMGLHVAFGSTDELYLRCEPPALKQKTEIWNATVWRGERLNAQVLVWSSDSQEQVRFQGGDLKSDKGALIGKERFKFNLVRYVLSNFPYQAKGFSCEVSNRTAYLMPDRFESFDRFALPGRTLRPVWLSIDIPATAEDGDYSGALQVAAVNESVTLELRIHVQKRTLPAPRDWKFRLDLWQNPWAVASYFHLQPWSEEHKALLTRHLNLYAAGGGKYITTYAVHSPWSDNSFVPEGTMIDWVKTSAGSWKFDYSIFDQYVKLATEAGVDRAITIYTPIPWGHRFRYREEKSGNYIFEEWSPKSEQFKAFWNVFLDDLKEHLMKKGWFEKTYLGINENPLEQTIAAAKVIKQNSKDWKITYAGDWHPELSSLIDDYSAIITREPDARELQERAARGATTSYYVCCNPPQPNNFVFSAPVESRYIGWYAIARGYNGFLRWAYDAWPADPMRDARHIFWPAGDCFLVYPGGNSSIRFEKLREGIADYEKIVILREQAHRSSSASAKKLMTDLENHLSQFIGDLDYAKRNYDVPKMTEALEKGKRLIEALSTELSQ